MNSLNFGICLFVAIMLVMVMPNATRRPPREPVDAFRMFGHLPRIVAIFTSTNDSSFNCLSATLDRYDTESREATYVWHFKTRNGTGRKDVPFYIKMGTAPNQANYYVDNDRTNLYTAFYNYTDYENCMVAIIPTPEHNHCVLWVKRSVARAVPQDCLDNYEQTCDVRVPQFDNDLCDEDQ
ncbi:uncharacterized protein LOC144150236 [Haemaphysalis longicornis]